MQAEGRVRTGETPQLNQNVVVRLKVAIVDRAVPGSGDPNVQPLECGVAANNQTPETEKKKKNAGKRTCYSFVRFLKQPVSRLSSRLRKTGSSWRLRGEMFLEEGQII